MKQARGSFFLAVILSTAVPAFADQIAADRMDGDEGSVAMQGLFHERALQEVSALRDFDLSVLKEDESEPGSSSCHHVRLYDLDSRYGHSLVRNEEKAHRKVHGRGGDDGDVSLVATPEPESLTLLLFG